MEVSAEAETDAARRARRRPDAGRQPHPLGAGVQLSATLHRTDGSGRPVEATAAGPLDSLPAAGGSARGRSCWPAMAGEDGRPGRALIRGGDRASTSRARRRTARGRYREAVAHFVAALRADSSFALAALDLIASANRTEDSTSAPARRGSPGPIATSSVAKGQAMLRAWLGPNYPASELARGYSRGPGRMRSGSRPTWPMPGSSWAIRSCTTARSNDLPQAVQRAEANFGRALELDSTFMMPLDHLLSAKLYLEDTTDLRGLARLWFAQRHGLRRPVRLHALAARPGAGRFDRGAAERGRMERWTDVSLPGWRATRRRMASAWTTCGSALDELARRAVTGPRLRNARLWRRDWLLNAGRPTAALALTDSLAADEPWPGWARQQRIDDALFEDGDTAAAAADVRALAASNARPACRRSRGSRGGRPRGLPPRPLVVEPRGLQSGCAAGGTGSARSPGGPAGVPGRRPGHLRRPARGLARVAGRPPGLPRCSGRADSIYLASDVAADYTITNLVTARLREATGDVAVGAPRVGRVPVTLPVSPAYIATYLRSRGARAPGGRHGVGHRRVPPLRVAPGRRGDAAPA